MGLLVAFIGVIGGSVLILPGMLLIAAQVRVHRIMVYSVGSWLFRGGMALVILGLAASMGTNFPELRMVGMVAGGTGLLGGVFVWNHERAQVLHDGARRWNWPRSLTVQMIGLGVLAIAVGLFGGL
jgi:hypothetical protein